MEADHRVVVAEDYRLVVQEMVRAGGIGRWMWEGRMPQGHQDENH